MPYPSHMTRSMHVLHLITDIELGGAEKQLAYLSHLQVSSGCTVYVEYLKGKASLVNRLEKSGVQVRKTGGATYGILKLWRLLRLIRKNEISIIHAHLPRAELFGVALKFLSKSKLIISRHNAERFWHNSHPFVSKVLALLVERSANQIICISGAVKSFIFDSSESKDSNKYKVVPYAWIPKDFFGESSKGQARDNNLHQPTTFRLITISRLVKQKNLENLIKAIAFIDQDITLEIFGAGPMRVQLEGLILELSLTNRVLLKGQVSNIERELQDSDLFILASNYEGFGLSVLEAIVQEIPVALAANPALSEIMGGDYPFFFKPNDVLEMSRVITEALNASRTMFVPFYRRVLENYNAEKLMQGTNNVYAMS